MRRRSPCAVPAPSHQTPPPVSGWVAQGFEPVRERFEALLAEPGEVGAAVAAYVDGRSVVDLWGGYADQDRTRLWCPDTIALAGSATKGMAATAMAVANSRGWLDYDAPVAEYWPEFAARKKETVTVGQLLAHQAGLCALDVRLGPGTLADRRGLSRALARQAPAWRPGTRHGYHAISLGLYEDLLIRRVDPLRRGMSDFFHDEVIRALGRRDFLIGLPRDVEAEQVADTSGCPAWPGWRAMVQPGALPTRMALGYACPGSLTARTLGNPPLSSPADFALPEYRHLVLPSAVGFGTARGLAAVYSALAIGGASLGLARSTFRAITAPPGQPRLGTRDLVLHMDSRYSHGWWRPSRSFPFGGPSAFGAPGVGGSFGYADPCSGIGYGFITNHMGFRFWDDPRELSLRRALQRCCSVR